MRDVYGEDTKNVRSPTYGGSGSKCGVLDVNLRCLIRTRVSEFEYEIRRNSLRGLSSGLVLCTTPEINTIARLSCH